MKAFKTLLFLAALTTVQSPAQLTAAAPQQIIVVQSMTKAINYRNLKGFAMIDFNGTILLPAANGSAEIRNKAGVTKIKAEFLSLTPESKFGNKY